MLSWLRSAIPRGLAGRGDPGWNGRFGRSFAKTGQSGKDNFLVIQQPNAPLQKQSRRPIQQAHPEVTHCRTFEMTEFRAP